MPDLSRYTLYPENTVLLVRESVFLVKDTGLFGFSNNGYFEQKVTVIVTEIDRSTAGDIHIYKYDNTDYATLLAKKFVPELHPFKNRKYSWYEFHKSQGLIKNLRSNIALYHNIKLRSTNWHDLIGEILSLPVYARYLYEERNVPRVSMKYIWKTGKVINRLSGKTIYDSIRTGGYSC